MSWFNGQMNAVVYSSVYEEEDGIYDKLTDYYFHTYDYRLARIFFIILENFVPTKTYKFSFSGPFEESHGDETEYSFTLTCNERIRLQIEYIFRRSVGYSFKRSDKLLRGKTQNYTIEEWN